MAINANKSLGIPPEIITQAVKEAIQGHPDRAPALFGNYGLSDATLTKINAVFFAFVPSGSNTEFQSLKYEVMKALNHQATGTVPQIQEEPIPIAPAQNTLIKELLRKQADHWPQR